MRQSATERVVAPSLPRAPQVCVGARVVGAGVGAGVVGAGVGAQPPTCRACLAPAETISIAAEIETPGVCLVPERRAI